jgi:hypothetical protein
MITRRLIFTIAAAAVSSGSADAQLASSTPGANQTQVQRLRAMDKEAVRVHAQISAAGGHIDFRVKAEADGNNLRQYGEAMVEKLRHADFGPLLALFPADQQLVERLKSTRGVTFVGETQDDGFRLNLIASSGESRTAVHEFLQVPKTNGDRAARHPGNNLGWDAPPQPDVEK